jgi:hypothetical protein
MEVKADIFYNAVELLVCVTLQFMKQGTRVCNIFLLMISLLPKQ